MAQHLGELPPHSENLSSVLNNHGQANNYLQLQLQGSQCSLWLPQVYTDTPHHTYATYTYTTQHRPHPQIYTNTHTMCTHKLTYRTTQHKYINLCKLIQHTLHTTHKHEHTYHTENHTKLHTTHTYSEDSTHTQTHHVHTHHTHTQGDRENILNKQTLKQKYM